MVEKGPKIRVFSYNSDIFVNNFNIQEQKILKFLEELDNIIEDICAEFQSSMFLFEFFINVYMSLLSLSVLNNPVYSKMFFFQKF